MIQKNSIRNIICFLICLMTLQSEAQQQYRIIKLSPYALSDYDFYCDQVIDKRMETYHISKPFPKNYDNNNRTLLIFEEDFTLYSEQVLNKFLPKKQSKEKLIFVFHEFYFFYDKISTKVECSMKIEIVQKREDLYYSMGFAEAKSKKTISLNSKGYNKLYIKALNEALKPFKENDWSNTKGKQIENTFERVKWDANNLPPEGYYLNFGELVKGNFIKDKSLAMKPKVINNYPRFLLFKDGKKSKERVMFVLNGEGDIYVHASKYHVGNYYLRAEISGKYIYFEDRYSDAQGGGVGGGIVGGAIGGLIAHAASNTLTGIVLDTETGIVKLLNERVLFSIIREHPDLIKEYRVSKRKVEDRRLILEKLNKRYQ